MRIAAFGAGVSICMTMLAAGQVRADVPRVLSVQGRLAAAPGSHHDLTLALYAVESGGAPLWVETHVDVPVVGGVWSVLLGSLVALDLPFDRDYWLGVEVDGGAELQPRQRLAAAGYALNAERLGGVDAARFVARDAAGRVGLGLAAGASAAATLDVGGGVRVGSATDCDPAHAGTIRFAAGRFEGCNGAAWIRLDVQSTGAAAAGGSQATAGSSCKSILDVGASVGDGVYWVDPNGGSPADAVQTYCDMTTDGGGWTAVALNGNLGSNTCRPHLGAAAASCGTVVDGSTALTAIDFNLPGAQQAALPWNQLLFVAFDASGYAGKTAHFGVEFPTTVAGLDTRTGGARLDFASLSTVSRFYCHAGDQYVDAFIDTLPDSDPFPGLTKFTMAGFATHNTELSFHGGLASAPDSLQGLDDFQGGRGCGDDWVPLARRGDRAIALVRAAVPAHAALGESQSNPGASCKAILDASASRGNGLYWLDPNGGSTGDAVRTYCDMTTDGGGWTMLAVNGDNASNTCEPHIGPSAVTCGTALTSVFTPLATVDFNVPGPQQAALVWQRLLFVSFDSTGYGSKTGYSAMQFPSAAATADARAGAVRYDPSGLTALSRIYCEGGPQYFDAYAASLASSGNDHYPLLTKFSAAGVTGLGYLSFHGNISPDDNLTGLDDYQGGLGCSDAWQPKARRGDRSAVFVR